MRSSLRRFPTGLVALLGVLSALPAELEAQQPDRIGASASPRSGRPHSGMWLPRDTGGPCGDQAANEVPGRNDRPNEPPGFEVFAEFNACRFPGQPDGGLGLWSTERRPMALMADPTAPESPPGVIVTRYPRGLVAGRGPVYWNGWDARGSRAEKRALYLSMWIKIEGVDFEAAPAVTKLGFIGYGTNPEAGVNQGFFGIPGGRRAVVDQAFRLGFFQQGHVDRPLHQNVDRRALMTVGRWHHWEAVLRVNDPGRANGSMSMWVDGTLIIHYADVTFMDATRNHAFTMYTWNPTWGGMNAVKAREDRILIDHVYLSGIPSE